MNREPDADPSQTHVAFTGIWQFRATGLATTGQREVPT
jgi:hypothetical protein